ncbi:MAG: MarR family transcriptional regulator [Thermoguttaceae bacterium]|nr:MarR family transcriptional regulator [Thermoguttaceae bacterium]MDW8078100.1 MarR family transcriptional regulator [Thermoguttaceae bacterium]
MSELHVSPAAMRIVRHLVGRPPQSIAELMQATGVTRTAIMEQLGELSAQGLVERTTERLPGRGRPRHRYILTEKALRLLFQGNQHLLVPALLRAIEELAGDALRRKILKRAAKTLADYYSRQIRASDPVARLSELCELIQKEGGVAEIVPSGNGSVIFRKRSCAFISMFEEARCVCAVDRELLGQVLGVPVRQVTSRHDGHFCCEFCIDSSDRR